MSDIGFFLCFDRYVEC